MLTWLWKLHEYLSKCQYVKSNIVFFYLVYFFIMVKMSLGNPQYMRLSEIVYRSMERYAIFVAGFGV